MHGQIVFIVSSVIDYSTNPLSYSQIRSVFTPAQRAEQTVRTLQSIRAKVPDAKILLVEMGREHAPGNVQDLADKYVYIGRRQLVRNAVDGPHKGYGEVVGLIVANRYIRLLNPDYCFKMSGRYQLNEHFQISDWDPHRIMAKMGNGWLSTTLYGFPINQYETWRRTLKNGIPFLQQGEAIENTMWRLLPGVQSIDRLGVSGSVAPWDQSVEL